MKGPRLWIGLAILIAAGLLLYLRRQPSSESGQVPSVDPTTEASTAAHPAEAATSAASTATPESKASPDSDTTGASERHRVDTEIASKVKRRLEKIMPSGLQDAEVEVDESDGRMARVHLKLDGWPIANTSMAFDISGEAAELMVGSIPLVDRRPAPFPTLAPTDAKENIRQSIGEDALKSAEPTARSWALDSENRRLVPCENYYVDYKDGRGRVYSEIWCLNASNGTPFIKTNMRRH